jgi:RNA polymerase sigma factor (sigma-70 family)
VVDEYPAVIGLVIRAQNGDKQAWDALVERYAPLVWSICRQHRLSRNDTEDVSRNVWLRLADQLGNLRDPATVAGWLATTTRIECTRAWRPAQRTADAQQPGTDNMPDDHGETAENQASTAERHAALREAFTHLPPCCQRLLTLLMKDPPVPDAQISAKLGIPADSIAPRRGRCLDKLRRHPAIVALINSEAQSQR